jgi:PAS domain S-box-containing protein
MTIAYWCAWYAGGNLAIPKLTGQESVALLMIAAGMLVYRTFRERYLLAWILGWLAFLVSRWTIHGTHIDAVASYLQAISQAEFVLGICLFAASVFIYTNCRKPILPLLLITLSTVTFAVLRVLFWPDSFTLRLLLEIAYRLVALVAAVEMIRFRWGRPAIGPWLLALCLLTPHLDWTPLNAYVPPGINLMVDLLLGFSMLLVVLDDSRLRMQRLRVINALSINIARAQQHGPMMMTALEELKALMKVKAAWFRVLEGDKLIIAQHIGISPEFLKSAGYLKLDAGQQEILQEAKTVVVKTSSVDEENRYYLMEAKFHHLVIIPVLGKKSAIGTLVLGSSGRRSYTSEDMDFLAATGHQLGIAVENLRLLEQVLRSQRQWMNTFDSIQDLILAHDSEFRIIKANQALLHRLEQAPVSVVGNFCEAVLPRNEGEWTGCPYCARGDADFIEGPDPCFGGHSMISTSSYSEQGSKQKGIIHVIRDTTERRAVEEKYRLLFEQVQEGVFVATPDGKLLDCNDFFVKMLGYSTREELMALNVDIELYASAEQREAFRREVEQHNYVRNFEVTLRKKDGTLLTAAESSFATRDAGGAIDRYQGFLVDMTEKKRSEDDMRRRNRELNALNAMAVIATQSFDLDEILNLTLRQVISLFGAETGSIYLSDLDETTFRRRAGWGQRSEQRARFSEVAFRDGFGDLVMRSRTEVITEEFLPHLPPLLAEFVKADGLPAWIWVLLWSKDKPIGIMGVSSGAAREYGSNDENLLVAIGRQLATTIEKVRLYEETCRAYEDLRRTQEQLLQSEKMSAVGQLISGVAHELNNPLTAILGYAQLLDSEGLDDHSADYVRKLFKQAQRTHRVVQNLLSFARQRKPQKEAVDIRKVLEETLTLRDYDLKVNNILVDRDFASDLPAVTADPHQLEQVFLNIINNSVDAILEGGHGGTLKVRVGSEDGHVCTSFHDNGPGIKDPKHIFDPFYTTKSVGKGTGLGLSICYGIVKEHGGDITAHNDPAGGAVVEVRLPASERALPIEAAPVPRREVALEGRILLAEDEEAVLEFERDVLAGAGAQVVTAMTSDDVKARLRAEQFDAIIINGKMPGDLNIQDAYRWITENCAALQKKMLVTFSSLADQEARKFLQENNVPLLVKPFEVGDLINHARRLLQKAEAASAS